VLSDPELKSSPEHDDTGRYTPARVVVRPADTQQVAAVITLCARHGTAVVPQGANTGLDGGRGPTGSRGGGLTAAPQRGGGDQPGARQETVAAGAPEFPANIRSSKVKDFTTIPRLGWRQRSTATSATPSV
jgi:hypothetical protein